MEKISKIKKLAKGILNSGYPVLFLGDRGLGKTTVAQEIAKELNREVFYLNVSQMSPENFVFPLVKGENVEFSTPSLDGKIILLDELTNRNPEMHSLLQSLVLDKKLGNTTFRDIMFIGTGNRPEDSTLAVDLPRPLIERFVVLDFKEPSKEEWASYTLARGGNSMFVSYILQAPDSMYYKKAEEEGLTQYPSPRNNTRTAILIQTIFGDKIPEDSLDDLLLLITGSSGKEVGIGFLNFLQSARYYNYEMFKSGIMPENNNEVLMLIMSFAEFLNKTSPQQYDLIAELFSFMEKHYPRFKHYLLTFLGLTFGDKFKDYIYSETSRRKDNIYNYLLNVKKSISGQK